VELEEAVGLAAAVASVGVTEVMAMVATQRRQQHD